MSEFKGQLGSYRVVPTGDDSVTLWSEFFDENCHSTHGAYAETLENYVIPCQIQTRLQSQDINILEVGFGLGLGLKATLESVEGKSSNKLTFVSLELDSALVDWAKDNVAIRGHDLQLLKRISDSAFTAYYAESNVEVWVLIGDGRKTLEAWDTSLFHAIYQDPFSPKKNPTLWSVEWFTQLFKHADQDCILATYSASVGVRKAMLEAGWHPESHAGFGPKRERTIARINGNGDANLERRLRASQAQALRDPKL